MYKWAQNSVATSDQKYWRLYQFDFMGLRNTTDVLATTAGERQLDFLGSDTFQNKSRGGAGHQVKQQHGVIVRLYELRSS